MALVTIVPIFMRVCGFFILLNPTESKGKIRSYQRINADKCADLRIIGKKFPSAGIPSKSRVHPSSSDQNLSLFICAYLWINADKCADLRIIGKKCTTDAQRSEGGRPRNIEHRNLGSGVEGM